MLSRKEFFKQFLLRGARAAHDLCAEDGRGMGAAGQAGGGFDLPATEFSPALLALEAERRGIDLADGRAEELRQELYRELTRKCPDDRPDSGR
jgi:hypothetical protein